MKIRGPSSFRVLKRKVTYLRFNASVNTGNSYPIFAIYLILAIEIAALVGIKFWSVIWLAAIIMFLAVFFFTASSLPCSSSVDELEKRLAALRNPWAKDWRTLFSAEVYDWGSFLQFVPRLYTAHIFSDWAYIFYPPNPCIRSNFHESILEKMCNSRPINAHLKIVYIL